MPQLPGEFVFATFIDRGCSPRTVVDPQLDPRDGRPPSRTVDLVLPIPQRHLRGDRLHMRPAHRHARPHDLAVRTWLLAHCDVTLGHVRTHEAVLPQLDA